MNDYSKSNASFMSEDVRALMGAFIAARLEMQLTATGKGNYGAYVTIDDIYDACIDALGRVQIAILHMCFKEVDNTEVLHTRLIHAPTGQWAEGQRIVLYDKPGNQGRGSGNTYARKLAVLSLCGLGCEDDDCDIPEPKRQVKAHDELLTPEHVKHLTEAINETKDPVITMSNIKSFNKVTDLSQLRASQVEGVIDYIKKCIKG